MTQFARSNWDPQGLIMVQFSLSLPSTPGPIPNSTSSSHDSNDKNSCRQTHGSERQPSSYSRVAPRRETAAQQQLEQHLLEKLPPQKGIKGVLEPTRKSL